MRQREGKVQEERMTHGEQVKEQIVNSFLSEIMPRLLLLASPIDSNFHTNLISYRGSKKTTAGCC